MNLTKEEKTVRNILINVASKKQLIYYSDLCKTANLRLDMSIPADRGKIGEILGHISSRYALSVVTILLVHVNHAIPKCLTL